MTPMTENEIKMLEMYIPTMKKKLYTFDGTLRGLLFVTPFCDDEMVVLAARYVCQVIGGRNAQQLKTSINSTVVIVHVDERRTELPYHFLSWDYSGSSLLRASGEYCIDVCSAVDIVLKMHTCERVSDTSNINLICDH